ncbi:MAG: hypothetical protein WDN04_06980 [Rhodospirillales bacterium]
MSEIGDDPETVATRCGPAIPGIELRIAGGEGECWCGASTSCKAISTIRPPQRKQLTQTAGCIPEMSQGRYTRLFAPSPIA